MSGPETEEEYLLVTEYFHPDTAKTGKLMTELAVGLSERGLDLTVWTSQPNYHSGENERQPRKSQREGVPVKRIRAPQFRQSSLPRRLFNWVVFTFWMSIALFLDRTDQQRTVVFVSNPPMLAPFLHLVCRLRGWEYTYIVHDLYPEQPVELEYLRRNGIAAKIWRKAESIALRGAENVVVLGPLMKERVIDKGGPDFEAEKVTIIHNWEDEEFIEPMDKADNWFSKEHDLVDPFTVLYSGNIAEFHDLETLVKAAAHFEDEDVKFLIIGEGDNKETITTLAEDLGVAGDTVKFLPYQDWDDLPYSLTSADASVVTVKEGFEGVCVSSKLYTAMAAGEPILGIVQPEDDEARIIDASNIGFHAKQGDTEGVIDAIDSWQRKPELAEKQGDNARDAFEMNFTKDKSVDRYYWILCGETVEPDVTQTEVET